MSRLLICLLASVLIIGSDAAFAQPIVEQSIPLLQITAPVTGIVVAPGSTITVVVTIGVVDIKNIIIIGQDPIGSSDALTSPPFQFPMTIPENIKPGSYQLIANATGAQGEDIKSSPITIDVEPEGGSITALKIQPGTIQFDAAGNQSSIVVLGMLPNGGTVTLTGSTLITYSSANTNVATVSPSGVITAAGPGTTDVVARTSTLSASVPVSVPNKKPGDLNGDGKVDIDDLQLLQSAYADSSSEPPSISANGPHDVRDLNHDGVIDERDAEILKTLCDHPDCAYK